MKPAATANDLWLDVLAWQTIAAAFALARRDDRGEYRATVAGGPAVGVCEAIARYAPTTGTFSQRERLQRVQRRVAGSDYRVGTYYWSLRTLEGVRRRVDLCLRCAAHAERSHRRAVRRDALTAGFVP